ncbi:MFS transporter [Alkalilimnicola sp. S0819]|uniref:MFS transporter n=1 Tax=Alkalilimnicola sp. S0819 TaxID=2613922 RepID=UPI00126154FE|nr:MFS transporter [Alkalilimnicola sp. S0819]KAB7627226.1 MFS transporter [Alkalilimnicola sp. S0819]MPQ15939.1 MFS transporter [Alkalilimnicola sp. S0819]
MLPLLAPFIALLLSVAILLVGSGLLGTLLAVRMGVEDFPTEVIGVVMACYSVGFVLATFWFPRVIQKVGHIRSFAVLAAIAAGSTLVYPIVLDPLAWGLMRVIFGFSLAGMYIVTESWLNDRTPKERRGQLLAVYAITTNAALGGGQFLLGAWDIRGFELFSLAAFLFALALVPVALTRARSPELHETRPISLKALYAISPLGAAGSLTSGLFNGSFMAMGPVFAQGVGFSVNQVASLMGATILGGLVLQYPIGRASDRYDRFRTIIAVALAVVLVSVAIALLVHAGPLVIIVLAALWGGLAFTIYPLSVALANDFMSREELVGAGAALLMVHGIGMIIGPIAAAALMSKVGAAGLFWGIAAAGVFLTLVAVYRNQVGEHVSLEEQTDYLAVPDTTPIAGTVMDPRAEEEQLEFQFDVDGESETPADEAAGPQA